MKAHNNPDFHHHDGYSRWHHRDQKHHTDLHNNVMEPVTFMDAMDLLKTHDDFKEAAEVLELFDDLIQKADTIDLLYKLNDVIDKLMFIELNNDLQNQQPIEFEDGKRAPNNVGMP